MNPQRLLQHFDRIAEAPDAVARLRRFILDLAVRGRLVEQDPNDEPASKLLNRIQKVKANRNLKMRESPGKQKLPPDTALSAFHLPAGWVWATLGDLTAVLNGRAYSKHELLDKGTPVLRVGNLFTSEHWYYSDLTLEDDKYCDAGDLLFAWSASFGPFLWPGPKVIYHYHIWKLSLHSESDLDKHYLYNFLAHNTQEIKDSGHGVSMVHMTKGKMEVVQVPLPPLAEQHRIVAKVDELMALCDRLEAAQAEREQRRDRLVAASLSRLNQPTAAAEGEPAPAFREHARFHLDHLPRLTTRPEHIKSLRQTILNLAVCGRLVPQDPNDETALEAFDRLKRSQRAACADERLRPRPSISCLTRRQLKFSFPATWELACFDDIFVILSGVTKGQKIAVGESIDVPYLRVANVQRGYLDLQQVKEIAVRRADQQRYKLRRNDILMTEGGDWDKLGRAAIWRDEIPGCIHQNHVFRVRPPSNDISPEWVISYVNSPLGRAFFEDASKQSTNLASINMTQLRGCPIPLPPVAEQHRIVAKVDELMAICDQLEAQLNTTRSDSRRLLEAVLHEALA